MPFKLGPVGLHVVLEFANCITYPGSFLRLVYIQSHLRHVTEFVKAITQSRIYMFAHSFRLLALQTLHTPPPSLPFRFLALPPLVSFCPGSRFPVSAPCPLIGPAP